MASSVKVLFWLYKSRKNSKNEMPLMLRLSYDRKRVDKSTGNDASYFYYLHGPLARTELGHHKVQGVDYAYTLQGWLKGMNSNFLDSTKDMGADAYVTGGNPHAVVSKDVFGFSLGYYDNDYTPIGGSGAPAFGLNYQSPGSLATGSQLFNGNISYSTLTLSNINNGALTGYSYQYDQLNRIKQMRQHTGIALNAGTWSNSSIVQAYKEEIAYDANGNITTYLRNGTGSTLSMDNLTYHYISGTNKLEYVNDAVASGNYTEDIDDQTAGNYEYDPIGNLTKDVKEGITDISWTVYGKINQISKTGGTVIAYEYDAAGNRVQKKVTNGSSIVTTFYVRDAQGNVMSVYTDSSSTGLKLGEQHIYGSSRLGMYSWGKAVPATAPVPQWLGNNNYQAVYDSIMPGSITYELSNHLGNVLSTISDKKIGVPLNDTTVKYYVAEVLSQNDYYPFGMLMPGRKFISTTQYRYGFNSQERSLEIGEDSYTAEYWQYDSRLVRRWNVDPVRKPWQSDYSCFSNSPIWKIDPKGDDDFFNADGTFSHRTKTGTNIKVITASGTKLLSEIIPNNPTNTKVLVNVIKYYTPQAGIPGGVLVGISPSTPNRGENVDGSLAFTNATGIMVSAKDGINPTLNNYNNLLSTLVHEENHRKAKDPEKGETYKFADHLAVYNKQIDDKKTFDKTDNEYKVQYAYKYASYLLGALNTGEISDDEFNQKLNDMNSKLKQYGIYIKQSFTSAGTPPLEVFGKDNNGKPVTNPGFVKPKSKPF